MTDKQPSAPPDLSDTHFIEMVGQLVSATTKRDIIARLEVLLGQAAPPPESAPPIADWQQISDALVAARRFVRGRHSILMYGPQKLLDELDHAIAFFAEHRADTQSTPPTAKYQNDGEIWSYEQKLAALLRGVAAKARLEEARLWDEHSWSSAVSKDHEYPIEFSSACGLCRKERIAQLEREANQKEPS